MKKLTVFILFFLLFGISWVFASDITGVGYGKTEKEAKKEALADLSQAIVSEVHSEFKTQVVDLRGDIKKYAKKVVQVKSNLPLLGVDFSLLTHKKEIMAEARFSPERAKVLYNEKLRNFKINIDKLTALLKKSSSDHEKLQLLTDLLTYQDKFYKYKTVAVMIACKDLPGIEITGAEIKNQLRKLEAKKIDSIDLAAKLISKNINKKNIYIYPPKPADSNEITQFGGVVRDKLSVYLKTVKFPKLADYFITGEYEKLKDGIVLTCHLISTSDFTTLMTRMVTLAPSAYSDYEIDPQTVDFEKLLYSGIIVSNDFRIDISTNKGKEDLLFKKGDEIELFIKMNSAGYFYMVGHTVKQIEKFSYILELNEVKGNRRFIYHVNADDVNKWISMGRFMVEPPFGVESLQVLASNKDLVDDVPYTTREGSYYIISRNPEKGVNTTRGLLKKKDNKNKKIAEGVLLFTSMAK